MNAYYITLLPASDAREGTTEINPLYANVKTSTWHYYRREATYRLSKRVADREAAQLVMKNPKRYIGRVQVLKMNILRQYKDVPLYGAAKIF